MLNEIVRRELYGSGCSRQDEGSEATRRNVQISGRQVAVVLLMMMILSSWALDSFHVQFVPRPLHDTVASFIDAGRLSNSNSSWLPSVDSIVAHNPLDDSPITFGSVVLLGIVCAFGLGATAFTMTRDKPE